MSGQLPEVVLVKTELYGRKALKTIEEGYPKVTVMSLF